MKSLKKWWGSGKEEPPKDAAKASPSSANSPPDTGATSSATEHVAGSGASESGRVIESPDKTNSHVASQSPSGSEDPKKIASPEHVPSNVEQHEKPSVVHEAPLETEDKISESGDITPRQENVESATEYIAAHTDHETPLHSNAREGGEGKGKRGTSSSPKHSDHTHRHSPSSPEAVAGSRDDQNVHTAATTAAAAAVDDSRASPHSHKSLAATPAAVDGTSHNSSVDNDHTSKPAHRPVPKLNTHVKKDAAAESAALKGQSSEDIQEAERVSAKNLDAIVSIVETFKKKLTLCGGVSHFLRVCRDIDEQSTPLDARNSDDSRDGRPQDQSALSGMLDWEQFVQVLEAIKLSMHQHELHAVFRNYRCVHEDSIDYNRFVSALGYSRDCHELICLVQASMRKIWETDTYALGRIEKYFSQMPEESSLSDFRSLARVAASRQNNVAAGSDLHSFDLAELAEFDRSIRALGTEMTDLEVRRLFSELRIRPTLPDVVILKAVEAGGNKIVRDGSDGPTSTTSPDKLFSLLNVPETVATTSAAAKAGAKGSDGKLRPVAVAKDTGKDKENYVALGPFGLRSHHQLIDAFASFFDVVKRAMPLPQPPSGIQAWAIVSEILTMSRNTDDLHKPDGQETATAGISRAALFQYIASKAHLALALPSVHNTIDSVLNATNGEITRLYHALNRSAGASTSDTLSARSGDGSRDADTVTLGESEDCISIASLFKLVGVPKTEALSVSTFACDIAKASLEAEDKAHTALLRGAHLDAMLGSEGSKFFFQINGEIVNGAEKEPDVLWSERTPVVPLTKSASAEEAVSVMWSSGAGVLTEILRLDDDAYTDPRWSMRVQLFEEKVLPSPDASEEPSSKVMSYFHGECSMGILDILNQYIAIYKSDGGVHESGEVQLVVPFRISMSLQPDGAPGPIACVVNARLTMQSSLCSAKDGENLSAFRSREEQAASLHNSSHLVCEHAGNVSNVVYLLSDLVKALLVKESVAVDIMLGDNQAASITKPMRPRRAARKRIEEDLKGKHEFRGRPVMTAIAARDKVAAAFRGWKTRRLINKMRESATAIQRTFRCHAVFAPYKQSVHNLKETYARERKHLERFRRIRAKERELTMLRRIPASDYFNYDRMRRDHSAKVLQRAWRHNKAPVRFAQRRTPNITTDGGESSASAPSTAALRDRQVILEHISRCNVNKRDGPLTARSLSLKDEPGRLALLHRRIKESAERKSLAKTVNMQAADSRATRANLSNAGADGIEVLRQVKNGKDGIRKQYQDLAESRTRLAQLLDDYTIEKSDRGYAQASRLKSLGNTTALLADLEKFPSLDEAREHIVSARAYEMQRHRTGPGEDEESKSAEFNKWYINVNVVQNSSLVAAVDRHVTTYTTMKGKDRWDVVSAPHDMTGPPISVKELAAQDFETNRNLAKSRAMRQRLATTWANRDDAQSSLCWVSYAAQQSKYDKNDLMSRVQTDSGPDNVAAALGIVSGHEVLERLSKEAASHRSRIDAVSEYCQSVDSKVDRLATEFSSQSMALLTKERAGHIQRELNAAEHHLRSVRVTQIQSLFRGRKDRRHVDSLRSQQRVAQALAVLVAELQRPGLRPGQGGARLNAVALDAALIDRIGNMQGSAARVLNPPRRKNPPQVSARQATSASVLDAPAAAKSGFDRGRGSSPGSYALSLSPSTAARGAPEVLPSPSSHLPRTPVSKRNIPLRSPDSRLSAMTGATVRDTMHSFDEPAHQSIGSGMGYVSSPSESMSQSALSLNLFSSPARPRSARKGSHGGAGEGKDISAIMAKVSDNFERKNLSNVAAIVTQALQAKLANFKLDGGKALLWSIVSACGGNALQITTWMGTHRESAVDGGIMDVATAALLLGELAHELALLDIGGEGTFQLIQLVLLLRMVAECWQDKKVRVRDVYSLMEDVIFQRGDAISPVQYQQLCRVRFDLMHMSSLKRCDAQSLLSRTALSLNLQLSGKLTVQDVAQLVSRISPLSAEEGASNLSSIPENSANVSTVNSQYLAELIVSLAASGSVGTDTAGACSLTQLEYFLCPLSVAASHESMLQRLRLWLQAVPSLKANMLDAFSNLALNNDVFSADQIDRTLRLESDLPVTGAEAKELAHVIFNAGGVTVGDIAKLLSKVEAGQPIPI